MSPAATRPAIGLFGGTFNPIHVGHLRAAEEVAEALDLACVHFVPAASPPHKRSSGHDPIAPAELRLAWVRAAVAGNPRFAVDDQELARLGPSYSVDTLRAWAERCHPARPIFVIGRDAFLELGSWRDPETIVQLADLAIMTRPPDTEDGLARCIPDALRPDFELAADGRSARHRTAGSRLLAVSITALDVSSSDVRARLRAGRSVRYLLPEAIHDAVARSGVYAAAAARSAGAAAMTSEP